MGVLTWKQASADYEKKSAGSNTAGTTPPTSGMLSWKQAADEFDRYDEDGYKALGMQRMAQMQEIYQAQKDRVSGMERLHADDTVNDWLNRYNRVMQGITRSEQKRNGGFTHDADSVYGAEIDALLSGYDGIKNHSEIRQYYDSLTELKNSLSAINESMAQFEDENAFDQYMAYWKDQEEKRNLDLDAYSRDISALEQQLDEYDAGIDWTDTNQRKKADKEIARMQEEIDRRKQYLAQPQRIQKKEDFSAVANPESDKYDAAFESKSGYVSTEQDGKLQRMMSQYSMGFDDLTYEYINNQNGIRDAIKQKAGAYKKGETPYEAKGYDYMTEDEVGLYNYYYSMGGKKSAEAYLETIQEDLNQRKAAGMYQKMEGKTGAELVFGVEAGLDQFKGGIKGAVRAVKGDDSYVAPSATQYASGMVREDLADDGFKLPSWLGGASLGQVGYDAITTTANMAPSIIGSVASNFVLPGSGAAVGSALLGGSAAGNAYQEALNEGYTVDQARGYGILSGASEIIMERLLGGISAYGGNALGKFFTQNMKNADTALKQIAKNVGGSMLSEFSEEYLQEVLTPWFRNLTLGTDEEVKLVSPEALYAGFLGAITGGVMEGPKAIMKGRNATQLANNSTPELSKATATAENATPGGVTEQPAAVDDKMSATEAVAKNATTTVGVSKMETVQVKPDIDSFAQQFGTQAEAVKRNYLEGQDLQEYEVGFQTAYAMGLEGGKVEALTKVPYLSQSQREIAFSLGRDAAAAQKAAAPKKAAMTAKMTTEEGTQDVTIAEVVGMDDTTMTFRLEDGRTVTDNDLDFEKGQKLIAAAWELGMDVKSVNTIVTESAANAAADADQAAGIQQAHHYGQYGYTMEQLTKHGTDAAALTDGQRKAAWEAGRQIYLQKGSAPAPALKVTKESGIWFDAGGGNVRSFDDADLSGLSEAAVAGARAAQVLQKLGIGKNYYFYESYVNKAGERVYKDENGQERKAPNGWYDKSTGSIHIDLNAGAEGKGLTMYTLSHELTHFVEKWSPKKYQALADFLVANYAKAGNVDVMVAEKQAELSAGHDSEVSYEDAYSEFIADSMEAMLSDGNVLEKLQELKKTDKSLFDKIREFFDNLGKKIREIYKDLTPDSLEGQTVLQMKDQIDQIQQLFAEALTEASENFQAAAEIGLVVDMDTESVSPAVLYSERTWRESDYVQERNQAAKEIAKAINVTEKKARQYIDSVNSIAKMIAEDRTRLDYFSSPGRSSFIGNVEYGGSFDFSTLCKKRRLLTGTFTAIQKALPNTALTANEILDIRNRMKDAGLEVSCGLCYVEGSRANMGQFAKEFLRLYKQYYPDAWQPNMADVNTPDGIEWVRINHPECYEQYEYFWNHYGTLKAGDKNLFASQQKPKLYQLHTEYKGEILHKFKGDDNVEEKNLNGGIRLQSFSDFEIVHLIDTMQIIMDMSRVGLAGQAYTKVPDFAWALGDTGLKINLSLIAKGVDASGNLIFDDIEGMPIAEAMKLRDRYSANVGTILVAFNDPQLMAAMADDRVDFIIPFHRSQWKKSQYEAMGLPAKTKDYTFMQNEKFIKPQYHEYRGRMVKDKATNYMPNEYWDFSKTGKENAEAYLQMCARNNKRPKFYKLLQNNGDGSYSLKADGSTDGYWKLLIDFKMYDNDGNGSPQAPVRPEFNMAEATRMLESYQGGHSNFPVAQGIVDSFVSEYKENHGDRMYSDRKKASDNVAREKTPTFYSYMGTVVAGMKQEKFGATSVVNMLRGKGVKAEEIKWSGIEAWLEGKKSVTKAELQEFIAGSMLQIEEDLLTDAEIPYTQEQLNAISGYEKDRDVIAEELKEEWKRIVGEDIPITHFGAGLESVVVQHLLEANAAKRGNTAEGKAYKAARAAMQKVIEDGDHFFGFDNARQALRELLRNPNEFLRAYELTPEEEEAIHNVIKTKEAFSKVDGIPLQGQMLLKDIAERADAISKKIGRVKSDHYAEAAKYKTKYGSYILRGGSNYRELLFRVPGATYQNNPMNIHWDRSGVLAHARIQDLNTSLGKMLFIEEIQSDWHNEGHKSGYRITPDQVTVSNTSVKLIDGRYVLHYNGNSLDQSVSAAFADRRGFTEARIHEGLVRDFNKDAEWETKVPDAPFRNTYHEFVLKRLIREAAENEYDSIGWTPADIQSNRWSDEYAEGYRIEYDQDIPKFLNKYGKKWGTIVGKTILDNGTEVWSMPITQAMKDSVLYEGQVMYQARATGTSNRDLLAGAFEDLARSPAEMEFLQKYQENIGLLNEQEAKLQEIRTEIRELTFGKGPKDPKRLEQLQEEAGKTANRIHIYDKKLLQLEAAKPLRDVLDREREKVRKATRQKGQEAMAEYREKRKESAARKDAKRKIRKTVMELDKLLNRGDKKKNVKSGMTSMVDSFLKLADALFMDEYTNRDMLRNGVGVELTDAEEKLFREAQQILQQAESGAAIEGMEFTSEVDAMNQLKKLDQKLSSKMAGLKDVFARERKRLYGTTVSDLLGKLADEYSRLSEAEDGAVRAAKDENVYAHLLQLQKDVGGTTVRDMTLHQMEAVADAFTMVLTTVRNANKMFAKNLKFKRDTLAGMVMGEIGAAVKKNSKLIRPGKNAIDSFSWNNLKPVYAFERLGSETLKTLYQNIRSGQDVWSRDMQEADAFRREQYRKHNRKAWDLEKQHRFEFESGIVELSLEQIMSLYAYSRREQALDHLLKGGFVFSGSTEVMVKEHGIQRRYLKKDATAYNLTADELLQVVDTLTKEQKAFVEEMQTYLSDVMGGKGNEISLQMYGIRSYGEKNYFPIRSAGQYMERAKEDSFRKEQGQISIVNSGFTKSTTPKANNPITLDGFMNVWAEHVNEMSMYHGFALPMEDFRRVYNYSSPNMEVGNSQSVNAVIENAFGKAATGYIDQLYKDLNGGALTDNREGLSKKLVGLHKKAAVFASASVVVQQPSAIVRAFALIDPRHFIGPKVDRKRHKQLWEEVKKYAPVAFVKEMGYFDTGMGRSARDFLQAEEYSGIREKMTALFKDADYRDEILGKAPALADELTWCSIWEAVKRETKAKNPGMDVRSDAFLQIAGARFSEVIDKTQVYDSVLTRSANMRSKAMHMNMLTSFMAEPTTSINMLEDALRKGDRKQLKRTVGAVYGSVVLNSLLVSLVYAARDDDEDETYWEKYLSSVAVEVLDGINPITYYPFLRDIWSIGQGFDVERADMTLITAFSKAAKNVISAGQKLQSASEEDEAAALAAFMDSLWGVADSVASLTGLPLKNIRRDIEGARNMVKTIIADLAGRNTTSLSMMDTVLGDVMNSIPIGNLLYSKSKRDQLYGALVAGDAAYIQRLRAGYESDTAYHSAIKMALRENDSRIWEAAVAWNAGDMETYIRIAKEIRGENRFDQDDIVLAIRAEANSMVEKEGSSASTVKGYFTNEKFGVAMGQNNVSMADAIRQDLFDTAVANGKTREEAEESVRSTARTQLKQLYANGTITGVNAEKMLVKYGGYDQKDAASKVAEWKYAKDFPELDGRISYTQYKRWEADGKSRGVSLEVFTDVAEYQDSGTSGSNRSQAEVADYINRLPISTAQKDALWCCFWKESTLYKNAPWH